MNLLITKGTETGVPTNPNEVAEGEIAFFRQDTGAVVADITAAALANVFMYGVQGTATGEAAISTKLFKGSDISLITRRDYVAPVQQSTFIGYDGSTKSIPEVDNGTYGIKTVDLTTGWEPFPRTTYEHVVSGTASQFAIATALAKLVNNSKNSTMNTGLPAYDKHFVTAEVYADEATAQLVDNDGAPASITLAVTKGSKIVQATVTAGADVDAAVGALLRIGHATAKTSPVYVIDAIAANTGAQTVVNITLNMPYAGETATGVAAGDGIVPAASDAAGIKLIAKSPATSFRTMALESLAAATITSNTDPQAGIGTGVQVKELERKSFPVRSYYETNYFPQTPDHSVNEAKNYDLITVLLKNDNDRHVLRENENSVLIVAIQEDGAAVSDILDIFGAPANNNG